MQTAILGAGALGKIVLNILKLNNKNIEGFYDDKKVGERIKGIKVKGKLEDVPQKETLDLIIAIGDLETRRSIYNSFKKSGYSFTTVIHPSCEIGPDVSIGEGTIIKDKAILEIDSAIGNNVVIGNGTIICHDSQVGDHCRIAPGVVIAGHVVVKSGCYLANNVSIDRKLTIGKGSIVASGCTIWKDVEKGTVVKLPNKMKKEKKE